MPFIRNEESLERVAGEMAFSRGRSYYLKGAVKTIARKDNYLEGYVQGSEPEPFHVRILFKDLDNFRSAECSCPFKLGSMCKHSVAVLLHWIHYTAITPKVDVTKLIFLDEKQLRNNAQIAPLPQMEPLQTHKPVLIKKIKKSDYLLPEYQYRSPQKPRIQIALSINGFLGGAVKSIPFKIFVIEGEKKLQVSNLKVFFNHARARNNDGLQFSMFSARQQYVLNLLNELLTMDSTGSDFAQPQFRIKRMQWAVYLGVMASCPGVELVDIKTNQPIKVNMASTISLTLRIRLIEKGFWGVKLTLTDAQNPGRDFSTIHIQEGHPVWLFDEAAFSFQPMHESITSLLLKDFLNIERTLDAPQIPYFISSVLEPLRGACEIIEEGDCLKDPIFNKPSLRCHLNLDYVKNSARAKLSFVYADQGSYPYEGRACIERFVQVGDEEKLNWIVRDVDQENFRVQNLLNDCSFEWKKSAKVFELSGMDNILGFVYQKLPILKREMDVHCSKDFEAKLLSNKSFEPVVRLTGSGIDWFEFDAVYRVEGIDEEITHEKIRKLIEEGQQYIRLKKGEVVPIPKEFFEQIENMSDEFDSKKLHLAQMPFVMEEIQRHGLKSTVDAKVMAIYDELKKFQSIATVEVPSSLSGVLRDYQTKGVDWLAFLRKFNFGGVLADEMGLGKTLQALTMIQIEIEKGNSCPSLVVCPTTLVWNWQEEIKKFLPNVQALVLVGNHRRDLFDQINKVQVVITSYSLLRRDIELYKKLSFNYVILDEAQNIKNRNTRNAQVAKLLKASMRLAMTGTPVENSIMDLWSIFDFLMPGFLGGAEKFKRRYEIPITKLQDKVQLNKLSGRILPFVLRRLKKDVIKDLPEKIEQISYCELEPTQAKIYEKMIESARKIATKSVSEKGFEKSRMIILTLILRLRQICCHPLISGVDLGHRSVSGKMELLKETLDELLAGGHKVLIFSQFVSMLRIIEDYLKREKIAYAYMDGSSTDRQEEVARFNSDPELKVFLLSLKVGGVGLNLTSADTVIIYEPWWNPAVENQAIDRVHRIGQSNSVLAYRLITKGTIEEKMLELQNRKRFLMDSLVLSEDSIGKKLDWEDIKFLLDMK
jgi:SNF2 family DNA or RNA helicase